MSSWHTRIHACLVTLNHSLAFNTQTSDQATNDQLEVVVEGIPVVYGVASRSVADYSLSLLKVHRAGLVTLSNPVRSSLKNNCTVLGVELQINYLLIIFVVADLDLFELHLWLADLKGGPVVA